MKNIESIIENMIPDKSQYIIGYADMDNLLKKSHNFRYAISIAKKLDDEIIDSIENGPNKKYFDIYNSTNNDLNNLTEKISLEMNKLGIINRSIKATVLDTELDENYKKELKYHTSHKMVATRAGIGWIGKTDLLISIKFGPRIRLASILTNHKFNKLGIPINKSRCKKCNICVIKCPAQAANGKHWNVEIERDDFYNPFKCRKKCQELSKYKINKEISLCGICISVCPKGKNKTI